MTLKTPQDDVKTVAMKNNDMDFAMDCATDFATDMN